MSDPFSVAASVAGVISLGAATTKLFYQFVSSIRDAPKEVQAITGSLYSVNIALCQIQTLLLDITYGSETADEDLDDLEQSVLCCVASFNLIENWLRDVCSDVTEDRLTTRRVWQQVKYVFQKDSLKEALERLENEKGTLQLIMSALNSKSIAQVLKVVRNAERAVQRNTQVIKRLELRITRELQDAIGRSHTTTSSISLDSICTQDEIERLLTDCGSALSLTLSDVSDDAASIIFIPDTLSGVDSSSVRIRFPSVEDDAEAVKHGQERESRKHDGVPISTVWVQENEDRSIARNIIDAIETNRLTAVQKEKKAKGGSLGLALGLPFIPESVASIGDLARRLSKLLADRAEGETTNLENARRCIERFEFYCASFQAPEGSSINDIHVRSCFYNAQDVIKQYRAFIERAYGNTSINPKATKLFVKSIQNPSSQFPELLLKLETSMSELDRALSFQAMMDQRRLMQSSTILQEKGIYSSQLEGLQMQKSLDEKVESTHKLLEAAISRMEGDRHPKSQVNRRNQRRRAGGRVRKDKASLGHETKYRTAENGQTPSASEPTEKIGLDEWESSHDEAGG